MLDRKLEACRCVRCLLLTNFPLWFQTGVLRWGFSVTDYEYASNAKIERLGLIVVSVYPGVYEKHKQCNAAEPFIPQTGQKMAF
jgi:hypothetical protein